MIAFTGNSVSSISKKSSNILDIFNKTINDLNAVNSTIDDEADSKQLEIERLTAEREHLTKLKDKHNKVIAKITGILED